MSLHLFPSARSHLWGMFALLARKTRRYYESSFKGCSWLTRGLTIVEMKANNELAISLPVYFESVKFNKTTRQKKTPPPPPQKKKHKKQQQKKQEKNSFLRRESNSGPLLACSRGSDRGDSAKRCEQKKEQQQQREGKLNALSTAPRHLMLSYF